MSAESITNETVKLSSQGKTTVPQQTRQYLGIEKGDRLSFQITEDGEVVVEKANE